MSNDLYRLVLILKNGQAVQLIYQTEARAKSAFVEFGNGPDRMVGASDDFGSMITVRMAEVATIVLEDKDLVSQGAARLATMDVRTQMRAQRLAQSDPMLKMAGAVALPPGPPGLARN